MKPKQAKALWNELAEEPKTPICAGIKAMTGWESVVALPAFTDNHSYPEKVEQAIEFLQEWVEALEAHLVI